MKRTGKELTDVEMIDTFFEIVNMTIAAYENPVREGFKKGSRCEQLGYDIVKMLFSKQIIETGKDEGQQRIEHT